MRFSTVGLQKAGLDLIAPFRVDVSLDPQDGLPDHAGSVEFHSVARVLPGRRVSGIGEFAGKRYFVKVFYGRQARRYWHREVVGAALLAKAGVPTAAVLRQGATGDGAGFVVFYEVLEDIVPFGADDSDSIGQVVDVVAALHDANLVQTDVHLGNFVRCAKGMVAVDSDSIQPARVLRAHFANFAMLLAQREPLCDAEVPRFWRRYARARGDYVESMGSSEQIAKLVVKQRKVRVARYVKKTMRECTQFHHVRDLRVNILCERSHWQSLQRFCRFPESVFGEGTPIKLGNSATVVRLTVDDQDYIIKRYNVKGLAHRIRRWVKKRARHAWQSGHKLAFLGIPTSRPMALVEQRVGWFVGVCYLVMPVCGEHSLAEVVATDAGRFDDVAPHVVDILERLAAAGLEHGDLKATNFIVSDAGVVLIDYDALRPGSNRADIRRFLANWQESAELSARWRTVLAARGLILPEAS